VECAATAAATAGILLRSFTASLRPYGQLDLTGSIGLDGLLGPLDGIRGQLDFVKDKQTTQQIYLILWTSYGTNRQPHGTTRLQSTHL
jgi:hypothetical protein